MQMNQKHLQHICTELKLGMPQGDVKSVPGCRGGSYMWRVNTEKESYAIKQLAPVIDLKNERIITKYELSETIAHRFMQQGIPAVSALKKSGKHLNIIENTGYLVYPWVEAYTLGRYEISQIHALKIADIIAKLHKINMDVPGIEKPHVDIHSSVSIVGAIDKAISYKCAFANMLKENQNFILSMYEEFLTTVPFLLEDTVVSHGDLDQLNVLWDTTGQAVLIDWESVRKINPTREIIRTSLSWSGFGTENFSLLMYSHMLRTYAKSGGILNLNHVNAALYGLVGSMVNWMLYNINIVCANDATEKETAMTEVNLVIKILMELKKCIPKLSEISIKN